MCMKLLLYHINHPSLSLFVHISLPLHFYCLLVSDLALSLSLSLLNFFFLSLYMWHHKEDASLGFAMCMPHHDSTSVARIWPYLITPNLKPVSESGPFVYTQFGPNRIWFCGSVKLLPGADSPDSRWHQLGRGNVCLQRY